MRFGLAQFASVVGDRAANLKTARRFAKSARGRECDVLVLPEIFDMGYDLTRVAAEAPTARPQPIPELQAIAKDENMYIIAGVANARKRKVYNSIVAINPQGKLLAMYDKTHLITAAPMHEEKHLAAGNDFVMTKIGDFTCSIMTCYDVRFPEVARVLALKGAEIIILPSAFPMSRLAHWEILISARAIENQLYILACNRIGKDGPGLEFCGTTTAIDPYGTILGKASSTDEALVIANVNKDIIAKTRQQIKVFQDRRPALYGEIVKKQK